MKNIKISFTVNAVPYYVLAYKSGRKTLEIQMYDGILTCGVQYDYDRRALELNAEAEMGDRVDIVLLAHRIELYVNGVLKDEEWPAGIRLFELGDNIFSEWTVDTCEYCETKREEPSVIASFTGAQGWHPGNGVFVGDCMPYLKDGEYHILYLKDRHHHRSKWGLGAHQWEHISTKDFNTWNIHPMAVPITDPSEGSICTGSWIRNEQTEYLYYTVRRGRGLAAPIRRSISSDGYHFEKDTDFGFEISEKYHAASARDPKVVKGADGVFHMFLTTSLANGNGCLAHFVSPDMESWQDVGEPIYISPDSTQPECPDYFEYHGKYYLVYSLHGRAHYSFSYKPFEGFTEPDEPIIPCESVPKGAVWEDKLVFTGFKKMGGYGGSMNFKSATALPSGKLIFED